MTSTTTSYIIASDSPAPAPATATKGSSQGVEKTIRRTRLHSVAVNIPASQSLITSNAPHFTQQQQQQPHANPDSCKTRPQNPTPNCNERIPYARGPRQGPAPVPYPALGPPPSYPPPPPPFTPAPGDTFAARGDISSQRAWDAYVYGNADYTSGNGYSGGQSSGNSGFGNFDDPGNMSMDLTAQTKKTTAKVLKWLNSQKD